MPTTASSSSRSAVANPKATQRVYLLMAVLAALLVLIGFARTYYAKVFFATPELPSLVHVHGIIMSLWFAVFILQVALVAMHRTDLHRRVGVFGAALALLVLIVGIATAIAAVKRGFTVGPPPLVFFAVPFFDMLVFAILAGLGIANRRRPDKHKRLMLLASLSMLGAAVGRIPLDIVAQGGPLIFFGLVDLLIVVCAITDAIQHRRLHPVYLWGGLLVIVSHPLRLLISGTEQWLQFATWLVN